MAEDASNFTASSRLTGPPRPARAKHRQREHALAVAAVGGAPVPFGCLRIVALDAHRIGVEFAEHRHRLRVALLLRALGREIERGLVLPALIGAENQIDIGIVGRGAGVTVASGAVSAAGLGVAAGCRGFFGGRGRFRFRLRGWLARRRRRFSAWRRRRYLRRGALAATSGSTPGSISDAGSSFPALSLLGFDFSGRRGVCLPDGLLRVHQCRRRAARIIPDEIADQDEIGAGGGKFAFPRATPQSRHKEARIVRPTIAGARRSPRPKAAVPAHRARRTAHNPRRLRPRPSNSCRVVSPPTPAMRSGFRLGSASSMAAMPVRCAPSAPARATSST